MGVRWHGMATNPWWCDCTCCKHVLSQQLLQSPSTASAVAGRRRNCERYNYLIRAQQWQLRACMRPEPHCSCDAAASAAAAAAGAVAPYQIQKPAKSMLKRLIVLYGRQLEAAAAVAFPTGCHATKRVGPRQRYVD